jgi:hypothetical protein
MFMTQCRAGGGEGSLIEPIIEYLKFIKLIELV